jgi:hypothetical protein
MTRRRVDVAARSPGGAGGFQGISGQLVCARRGVAEFSWGAAAGACLFAVAEVGSAFFEELF